MISLKFTWNLNKKNNIMDMESIIKTQIKEALCEEFEKDILFNMWYFNWGEFNFRPNFLSRMDGGENDIEVRHTPKTASGIPLKERTSFKINIVKHKNFIFALTPEQLLDNKLYNYVQLNKYEKEKQEYLKKNKELLDMMPEDKRIKFMRELKLKRIVK